jgi:RND superfamily putative drug exporter
VISCAALIITCMFVAFVLYSSAVVKMQALGLGVSIIVDATIIRLLVVPPPCSCSATPNGGRPAG